MGFFAGRDDDSSIGDAETTSRFVRVAEGILDSWLAAHPEQASRLGVHDFDPLLGEREAGAIVDQAAVIVDSLGALDDIDDTALCDDDAVDLEIIRGRMAWELWETTELRTFEWNPLQHSPGRSIHDLIFRPGSDLPTRLRALASRLERFPDALQTARETLTDMPQVHVVAAIEQFCGARELLGNRLDAVIDQAKNQHEHSASECGPDSLGSLDRRRLDDARDEAAAALADHERWLIDELPHSHGDPVLGPERFSARLWYALDSTLTPDAVLTRAESDLIATEELLAELSARRGVSDPRELLAALRETGRSPHVLSMLRDQLAASEALTAGLGIATVPDDPRDVMWTPPSYFGSGDTVSVPGSLDDDVDALTAVSYLMIDGVPDQLSLREADEYSEQLGELSLASYAAREGVPGRLMQQAYARRYRGHTRVRSVFPSASFSGGWAVYAEEALAALRMERQPELAWEAELLSVIGKLGVITDAIVDIRVHAHGMTEDEALRLLVERGYRSKPVAKARWRQVLLNSTELTSPFAGYTELVDLLSTVTSGTTMSDDVRAGIHDEVLSHGTLAPRHLAALLI
ncbi:DUF885 family protein [Saxibacter everestensis]|uniref:DUF885 family protein n=1 Tax=Saxibacter everestensis TaxID=2909229 RepID=A0ABY8QP83_9MICO|nr:DUF885 family protein [Brevibacteriaceae bacterium ZFBP1038]